MRTPVKVTPKPDIPSLDDVWADLDRVTKGRQFPTSRRPPGSFTTAEYADRPDIKINYSAAKKRLESMAENGVIERCGYTHSSNGGRLVCWRVKKRGK